MEIMQAKIEWNFPELIILLFLYSTTYMTVDTVVIRL